MAERNDLLSEALVDIFLELDRGATVQAASTMAETLALTAREQPHVVVLDAWLSRRSDTANSVRQVLECSPRSLVVVIATAIDADFEVRMRNAGAAYCVPKESVAAFAHSILDAVTAAP